MCPSLSRILPIVIAALTGSAVFCEADVFSKVPEAAEYGVAYEISIPINGGFRDAVAVPYAINNSATVLPFDRVAYYLELTAANGSVTWVYASMDTFTTVASQLGLPHNVSNPVSFQQEVKNLTVRSNVAGVQTGAFDTGNLEIFPANYSAANALAVFAASASTNDWGDTVATPNPGYGCLQVHNHQARQVVLAYNHFSDTAGGNDDIGIGNQETSHPDWTFAANSASYTSRKLVILTRPKRFQVAFSAVPKNRQVTPRDLTTNTAIVPIAGTETLGGLDKAVLRVLRNGVLQGAEQEQTLSYVAGSAAFAFSPVITAELAEYSFEIHFQAGANRYLARRVDGVVAGDVLLFYGQSNAEAAMYSGSASAYASPWVRTFGVSSDSGSTTSAYLYWVQAVGDGSLGVFGGVGQWPLVVGRKIVNDYQIPVAILNGARGGYSMPQLQRDDANPDNLDDGTTPRTYNRLRHRAIRGSVASGARAMFFYQGESDVNNTAQHTTGFASLHADWQVDYPGLQRIFVTQLHVGCGNDNLSAGLRDAQRRMQDNYAKVRVMSSNALPGHDGCHYSFAGYEQHGLHSYRQAARELYGAADAPDLDPPNPARVELAGTGDRLRVVLRRTDGTITFDPESLVDFRATGTTAVAIGAAPTADGFELQFDQSLAGITSLDYVGHIGSTPGWVTNTNGIGLLTFSEPVVSNFPVVSIASPTGTIVGTPGQSLPLSASATSPTSTIVRMELLIDGILHTAVNGTSTITANWTVPASGQHRVTARAFDAMGRQSERSVAVLTGIASAPGGVASGLTVWLRPESGIVRDVNGFISQWQDSSGAGNSCTQATTTAQPRYVESAFGAMPGVSFDGTDFLTSSAGMTAGSYTKVVRFSLATLSTTNNLLSSSASTATAHALYFGYTAFARIWHSGDFVTSTPPVAVGQIYTLTATYDATTNLGTLYLDGTQIGTGTAPADNTQLGYQLGAFDSGNFLAGNIGEAMIYNRVLSNAERGAIVSYLAQKATIPDAPRTSYASWSTQIPSGIDNTFGGDADSDGVSNGIEFALGRSPLSPESAGLLTIGRTGDLVSVNYQRPTSRGGVLYQLRESSDLQTWVNVVDSAGPAINGVEERRYQRNANGAGALFYHLRVTLQP